MAAKLRVAIIGVVGHLNYVLDGLLKTDDCTLAAVAKGEPDDQLERILSSPASKRDRPKSYDDYRKMLDEVRPDIACVFMRYHRIAEASIEAVRQGCHVVCEKPVATELADLQRVRDAVEQAKVRLTTLLAIRFEPLFLAARRAVAEGMIGEPALAFGQKSYKFGSSRPEWYKQRKTYGGTIPWVAIHAIDFVRFVTGLEYTSVAGVQANKVHPDYPECEDCGALLFKLSNGGQAAITFDYLRPATAVTHGDDRLRVAGSQGVIEVRAAEGICQAITQNRPAVELPRGGGIDFFADFLQELRGEGQHLIKPDEPFRITEVALKAREAADTGQIVRL